MNRPVTSIKIESIIKIKFCKQKSRTRHLHREILPNLWTSRLFFSNYSPKIVKERTLSNSFYENTITQIQTNGQRHYQKSFTLILIALTNINEKLLTKILANLFQQCIGLPWFCSGQESTSCAWHTGSIPGPGRFHISHSNYTSAPQLLMPACFGVHKPQLLSLSAASTETRASRVFVLQKERPRNEKPTYHNQEQLPWVMSKIFTAKSGIRQECPLSLLLFNIILDFLDTVQGKEKTSKLERKHCHYLQMTRYYIPKALKF